MKRLIYVLPILMLLFGYVLFTAENPQRVIVIGDSTAASYEEEVYPRMGWAQVFQGFFNENKVAIINRAQSGRSSKTFYQKPADWSRVKAELEPGDILFIQFGHNDGKIDPAVGTAPFGEFQSFLGRYIQEANTLGAIPILLTPIHRNRWEEDSLELRDTHRDYLVAIRQVAMQEDAPLIDLAALTDSMYEAQGIAFATDHIFLNLPENLYPNFPEGRLDDTHLQESGAYEIAKLVADAIYASDEAELSTLREGLLSVYRINLEVSPEGGGYLRGPRYLPVGVSTPIKAFPATSYKFKQWEVKQQVFSTWAQHYFKLFNEDTLTRVARFERNDEPDTLPKVGISITESQVLIQTNSPVIFLRVFDTGGREAFSWVGKGICDITLDKTPLKQGIYYLYLEWKDKSSFYKVLL